MKNFLNSKQNYIIDAFGKCQSEEAKICGVLFNRIRKEYAGKTFGNYEMMLLLSKKLDLYRSMDVLTVLVNNGVIMRQSRGKYCFTSKPIYYNVVYKAYIELRAKHLRK